MISRYSVRVNTDGSMKDADIAMSWPRHFSIESKGIEYPRSLMSERHVHTGADENAAPLPQKSFPLLVYSTSYQ